MRNKILIYTRPDPINPKFNRKSTRWVSTTVQKFEVAVIRQNNAHGFESLGWDDPNEKLILYTKSTEGRLSKAEKLIWKRMIKLSEEVAVILNKYDEEEG